MRPVGDAEVFGIFQPGQQAAREFAFVGNHRSQRQALGIGIDRKAEQYQLHDRDGNHHREGQPVAPDLAEFLDQDGEKAGPVHSCLRRSCLLRLASTR